MDMKRYTKTLIMEETNLGNLIEEAIKNNMKEDEAAKQNSEDGINLDEDDIVEELEGQLHDQDFEEYSDFLDNEAADDASLLDFLSSEEVQI